MADYIDRDKAILEIESHLRTGDVLYPLEMWEKERNEGLEIAASIVNNLPSADVTLVVRGKWVYLRKEDAFDIHGEKTWGERVLCERCGFEPIFIEGHGRYDFCPNCGAYMGEGEADEKVP